MGVKSRETVPLTPPPPSSVQVPGERSVLEHGGVWIWLELSIRLTHEPSQQVWGLVMHQKFSEYLIMLIIAQYTRSYCIRSIWFMNNTIFLMIIKLISLQTPEDTFLYWLFIFHLLEDIPLPIKSFSMLLIYKWGLFVPRTKKDDIFSTAQAVEKIYQLGILNWIKFPI